MALMLSGSPGRLDVNDLDFIGRWLKIDYAVTIGVYDAAAFPNVEQRCACHRKLNQKEQLPGDDCQVAHVKRVQLRFRKAGESYTRHAGFVTTRSCRPMLVKLLQDFLKINGLTRS
jgi:hypothetical protein